MMVPMVVAMRPTITMMTIDCCVPRMTTAKMSRPISSCPKGCAPSVTPAPPSHSGTRLRVGAPPSWAGGMSVHDHCHQPGVLIWIPNSEKSKPTAEKASTTMNARVTIEMTAPLWRKNRRRTIWPCERPSTSLLAMLFSASVTPPTGAVLLLIS